MPISVDRWHIVRFVVMMAEADGGEENLDSSVSRNIHVLYALQSRVCEYRWSR